MSGKIAGGMFGFDIASMIGYKLGGEDNPIYQLNMACHSNDVYNYFQFGTNIVAAFTGGAASNKTCFIAGTLIVTGYGLSKIENIKPGDLVLSTNTDTMETGYKKVLEKYVRKTRELVHIVVGGEEIVSTPDHPYFVVGRGFVNAGQLCIGSPLQNADGKILEVEQIYKEYLEEDEEVTVYNFQVEDWHTYHVGEMEVLVHKANCRLIDNGDGTYDAELSYKEGWSEEQITMADEKVAALSKADTRVVKEVKRGKTSASSKYKSAYGKESVPKGNDIDHTIDLQLGGEDIISNMNPLDKSVNRSLGSQIHALIKDLPVDTVIKNFTIVPRI